ncbi:hypothetical protein MRX96_012976 [Rhipicephalus microplus]
MRVPLVAPLWQSPDVTLAIPSSGAAASQLLFCCARGRQLSSSDLDNVLHKPDLPSLVCNATSKQACSNTTSCSRSKPREMALVLTGRDAGKKKKGEEGDNCAVWRRGRRLSMPPARSDRSTLLEMLEACGHGAPASPLTPPIDPLITF